MTDPKRLLDDADLLTNLERHVLAADARFAAPPEARSTLWSSLAVATGTAAIGPSLSSAGAVGSNLGVGTHAAAGSTAMGMGHALSLGAVVKLALFGIGIGTSVATANHFWSARDATDTKPVVRAAHTSVTPSSAAISASAVQTPSSARPIEPALNRAVDNQASATAPDPMTAPESLEAPVSNRPSSDEARTTEASGASGRALAPPEPKDRLSAGAREESQLVGSARSLLRAGNAVVALQLIELATSRFPRGILIQEREALRIEALVALGRTGEARARADAFVKAYPNSPYMSRVKSRE